MTLPLPSDDDELVPAGELDARTAALQSMVAAVAGRPCAVCGAPLCGHGAVLAVVLGARHAPRCVRCEADEHGEAPAALADRALQWIVRRDCFLRVWRRASAAEGFGDDVRPACLFAGSAPTVAPIATAVVATGATAVAPVPAIAATYDAGDLGCGDLVLELRGALRALPAGAVLRVVARDPAAPIDLPAWCGLVGHTLLSSDHPHYLIQRKRD